MKCQTRNESWNTGLANHSIGRCRKTRSRISKGDRQDITQVPLEDRDVMIATKIKIAETIIFPIVTYRSESWTVQKDRKKIDTYELWTWRKILRVPWTERRTNLSIVEEIRPKRTLEAIIIRSRLRYFSHVMRAKGSLKQDIMLRKIAGHRRQGKPRLRWLDSIKDATSLWLEALKDRKKCCKLVEKKSQNRERTNVK
jgi:hypothetical protein